MASLTLVQIIQTVNAGFDICSNTNILLFDHVTERKKRYLVLPVFVDQCNNGASAKTEENRRMTGMRLSVFLVEL